MSVIVRLLKPECIHLFMYDQPLRSNVFAIAETFFFIRIKDRLFLNRVFQLSNRVEMSRKLFFDKLAPKQADRSCFFFYFLDGKALNKDFFSPGRKLEILLPFHYMCTFSF